MIYRPDIKPPMWGPPEAVQYAVRHNAEQMGIDPLAIKVFIPTWEGGGDKLHNYGTYIDSTLNGDYTWENGGLRFDAADGRIPNNIIKQHTDISFLFRGKHVTETGTYPTLIGLGGDRELTLGTNNDTFRVRQYLAGTSVGGNIVTPDVSNDKISDVVFSYNYSAGVSAKLYLDGEIVAQQAYDLSGGDWHRLPNLYVLDGTTVGWLDTLGLFTCALSDNQVVQLRYEPYALIMPVARPFIFDMAGGSGPTTLTSGSVSFASNPLYMYKVLSFLSGDVTFTGNLINLSVTIDINTGSITSIGSQLNISTSMLFQEGLISLVGNQLTTNITGVIDLVNGTITFSGNILKTDLVIHLDPGDLNFRGKVLVIDGQAIGRKLNNHFRLYFNMWG